MDTRASDRIAEEQAALRRVAVLVAQGAPPEEIFTAVTAEVERLMGTDLTAMVRYDPDGAVTHVARGSSAEDDRQVGLRTPLSGRNVVTLVFETGRPARIDDISQISGPPTEIVRRLGIRSAIGVPITVGGRLWGVMLVSSTSEDPFPADTEARLSGFTELVGTAIANAQARVELRGYAEEQAALRRVATLVAGGASPEEVFAAVAAEAGRLLGTDLTGVVRYDPGEKTTILGMWSSTGAAMPFTVGTRPSLGGKNLATLVFQTGRPARFDDYGDATGAAAEMGREWGFRAAVAAPITVEGRLWGILTAISTREERLPADAEARLAGFTELAGTAIANAQVRVELRGYAEEQAVLRRVATLVAGGAPPEKVYAAVAAEAGRLLGAGLTGVGRYDRGDAVTFLGAWSSAGTAIPFPLGTRAPLGGRNMATLVFETGRSARMDDYSGATGAAAGLGLNWGYRAAVGAPITVESRLWGLMVVASTGEERLPADAEARLAGFTELVGTAIANTQARVELRGYAEEQAALRRVATLVAGGAPPEKVFAAVAEEIGRVVTVEFTSVSRYYADGTATIVGVWTSTGTISPPAVGDRLRLGGRNLTTLVYQTGQPARIDDYSSGASGAFADVARGWGARAAVGVPIRAGGRLWGVVNVWSAHTVPLPGDAEARLAAFTELVGTAIANAETQDALAASRVRIVAAADEARRRIERDLHDGAQQRLVTLALRLREAQAAAPPEASELLRRLDGVAAELEAALEELREIARGIHPAMLTEGGLEPALKGLARRCPVPVDLRVRVPGRLSGPVEIAAYYVVSEALTNTAKHAGASAAEVEVIVGEGVLRAHVRDDGRGGAAFSRGSGLLGLRDRVEALGGRIWLYSPPGAGTTLEARIPLGNGG